MVLNDGETHTNLDGCFVVSADEEALDLARSCDRVIADLLDDDGGKIVAFGAELPPMLHGTLDPFGDPTAADAHWADEAAATASALRAIADAIEHSSSDHVASTLSCAWLPDLVAMLASLGQRAELIRVRRAHT